MRHADLFSGIGGFSIAAQWMGWENVFQVEKDEFCQKVLTKNFPQVKRYGDIREFDGTPYRGTIDILTGGFPCQTFSVAGKGELDLSLWKEYYRCVLQIKPRFIVAENVPGIIGRSNGKSFDEVCEDLEIADYEVTPIVLPAGAVASPQYRYRIWIVAHSNEVGRIQSTQEHIFSRRTSAQFHTGWAVEPEVGRVAYGLSGQLDRNQSIGNAIVPQVAFEIFKAIEMTQI